MSNLFEEIKERVSLDFPVRHRGIMVTRDNKILCPYHEEKTPSFSLDLKTGYGHCFGCGKNADVIDLEYHLGGHSSMYDAATRLNELCNLGIKPNGFDKEKANEKQMAHKLLGLYCDQAHETLLATQNAIDWLLREKGITIEAVEKHRIGLVGPDGVRDRTELRKELGLAEKLGLLKKNKEGNKYTEHFRARLLFPITQRGKIMSIHARAFPDGSSEIKWLGLPHDNEVHNISPFKPVLWPENLNRDICLITESVCDAIALDTAGFYSSALMGTSINEGNRGLFEKAKGKLIIALDGDEAGREAGYKLAKQYKGYILELDSDKDLDELLAWLGPDKFKSLIDNGINRATFYLDAVIEREELREALRIIDELEMATDKGKYLNKLADRHKVNISDLKKDLKSLNKNKKDNSQPNKESKDIQYIAVFPELVDICEDDDRNIVFLIKERGQLSIYRTWAIDGVIYAPPPRDGLQFKHMPNANEVIRYFTEDTDASLFRDVIEYFHQVSELPDDRFYELVALWVFHTYLLDKFNHSPYLWFFGIPERGKSRTGRGIVNISYRGMAVESLRDAYLIRVASDLKVTLFIDCMDIWKKAERLGNEDFLLQRFERGAKVARVLYPDKGAHKDTVYYDIFGATVIATNEGVHQALESRTLLLTMPEAGREFDDVDPAIIQTLKERLTAFRARYLDRTFPEIDKPIRGRLGDITKPLMQVVLAIAPEKAESFKETIASLDKQRKAAKSDSLDGRLISILSDLSVEVVDGLLSLKCILRGVNEGVSEKHHISSWGLGWKLGGLGFTKRRRNDGVYIEYDLELIDRLKVKFGLSEGSPEHMDTPPKKLHELHKLHSTNKDGGFMSDVLSEVLQGEGETTLKLHRESADKQGMSEVRVVGEVSLQGGNGNFKEPPNPPGLSLDHHQKPLPETDPWEDA